MIYIFLPAYNEAIALPRVVKKFSAVLEKMGEPFKFVVLDDGSRDETAGVARELSRKFPLELLRHEVNRGLGETLRDGIEHVARVSKDEDLMVMLDCDDTHEPQFLPAAVESCARGMTRSCCRVFVKAAGRGNWLPSARC